LAIVDDEERLRRFVDRVLRTAGYETSITPDESGLNIRFPKNSRIKARLAERKSLSPTRCSINDHRRQPTKKDETIRNRTKDRGSLGNLSSSVCYHLRFFANSFRLLGLAKFCFCVRFVGLPSFAGFASAMTLEMTLAEEDLLDTFRALVARRIARTFACLSVG
jgi:hypothetical protein